MFLETYTLVIVRVGHEIYICIHSYNTLSLYVKFVGVDGLECDTIEYWGTTKRISWKDLLMRKCRLWSEAPGGNAFTMQVLQECWDILKMILGRRLLNFLIERFNWCFNINSSVILGGVANGEDGIRAWICSQMVFYWRVTCAYWLALIATAE